MCSKGVKTYVISALVVNESALKADFVCQAEGSQIIRKYYMFK